MGCIFYFVIGLCSWIELVGGREVGVWCGLKFIVGSIWGRFKFGFVDFFVLSFSKYYGFMFLR